MPQINQLSAVDRLQPSDQVPIYSSANGDARKASMSLFLAFIKQYFASPEFVNQFNTPGATGFNVQVNDSSDNTWLVINPSAGYASGAITMPYVDNCVDGQEVLVNCTQQVAAFTVNGNGAIAVSGEPSALGADDFFRMRFHGASKTWYRVG